MKLFEKSSVPIMIAVLVLASISAALIVDGRTRQDPSEVVWEGKNLEGFSL